MISSRREFAKASFLGILLAAIVGPISMLTGCGAATIAQAIIASFSKVMSLLASLGIVVNSGLVGDITAALNAFSDAYNAYEANKTSGTLAALAAAAQAALTDVQTFLSQTDLGGPIAQVAVALLEIIISTLMSFIPAPPAFKLGKKTVVPVTRTRAQYISDWDAVCVKYGHVELEIK
jgi:hypothetical protein